MATKVEIPALGESVTEAILVKWLKADGDTVAVDDPICELETDKANVELPSPAAGVLRHKVAQGTTVKIGDMVAEVGAGAGAGASKAPAADKPAPKAAAPAKTEAPAAAKPAEAPAGASRSGTDDFSPSVRRAVKETGVDPSTLHGSGPRGRVVKEDVMAAVETAPTARTAPPMTGGFSTPAQRPASAGEGIRREPMTKIRKKIAERLVAAQHTAAMLTTFNEVDMSQVLELRERYKEQFQKTYGVSLGLMSFFARAVALALKEFPVVNASIEGEDIVFHDNVNLGIAVSTERGLVVPVLRKAEDMSFSKIESEIKRMATSAKDGKLGLNELGGGTFTITNGGVFGSLLSTPILNPPQSGILGLHAIQKRPIVVKEEIAIRPMMYVALSYDHRLVDGRDSVSFLVRVKNLLEDPHRLMLAV
ncbi:2-oxoglutarate dehydrogenase complex dihydrolipoyllysine-residue succinyltransferase [bacterium]|nr:2-oxoglutarate dehydrogenase complex dihydrolipoyllysine-residue succinyltransferase [bacterium]